MAAHANFRVRKRKRGIHEFIDGKVIWRDAPEEILTTGDQYYGGSQQTAPSSSVGLSTTPGENFAYFSTADAAAETGQTKKDYITKKKTLSSQWATLRKHLTEQMVENAYPTQFKCCLCKETSRDKCVFRCQDCGPNAYFCKGCCDCHHSIVFLHVPQMWNNELQCYQDCTTQSVWKRPDDHDCSTSSIKPVIIIDDKGRQHCQGLQICKCHPIPVIMLSYGLWAASPANPRVAFTLDFMLTLRAMVLEGAVSLNAFCSAFQRCRSGLFRDKKSEKIADIYRIINWETVLNFMAVYHDVSYLQYADIDLPDGATCEVCPETKDTEGRRMTMDGNMNLVRRQKAGHSVRNPIHQGRYFLPQTDVDQYLKDHDVKIAPKDQTCSNFQAGSIIRSKNKTEKLEFTGVFASVCSHDFPCYIFNLRHGERMAYPIFMLKSIENLKILLYDLGCQLEKVVKNRDVKCQVTFGVPIFHVYGHNMGCQFTYNPRSITGAGLFDGEGTERLWSYLGRFRNITKEMTSENRSDLIVEALLNYSQRIIMKMGQDLSDRFAKAYMLKKGTKQMLEEDLPGFPAVTMTDIDKWSEDEKELSATRRKVVFENWEAGYALDLHEYYSLLEDIAEEEDEQITRVDASLRKLERKHHIKRRWAKTSALYKRHLAQACKEKRFFKLEQLRDAVVEYSYQVMAKKRYARGYSTAKRITKQVLGTSKKVNKALKEYNDIPPFGYELPHHLQRSDVAALDAAIWQHLIPATEDGSGVPGSVKRKLIDGARLNKRAKEEIEMTVNDMKRLIRSLLRQDHKLSTEIERLKAKESLTVLERGSLSLLVRRLKTVYSWQNTAGYILDKTKSAEINVQEFVEEIESQLNKESEVASEDLLLVSEDSIREMYADIRALEDDNDLEEEHGHEED